MKAFIVSRCGSCGDDGIDIGVYLDEKKCINDLEELNKPRREEEKLYEECRNCIDDDIEDDMKFILRDKCARSCIKKDRHGEYCENDKSEWYDIRSDSYYMHEVDVLG